MSSISNSKDTIDSRDIIDRIAELEDMRTDAIEAMEDEHAESKRRASQHTMFVANIQQDYEHSMDCRNTANKVTMTQLSDNSGYAIDCADCGIPLLTINSYSADITSQHEQTR